MPARCKEAPAVWDTWRRDSVEVARTLGMAEFLRGGGKDTGLCDAWRRSLAARCHKGFRGRCHRREVLRGHGTAVTHASEPCPGGAIQLSKTTGHRVNEGWGVTKYFIFLPAGNVEGVRAAAGFPEMLPERCERI